LWQQRWALLAGMAAVAGVLLSRTGRPMRCVAVLLLWLRRWCRGGRRRRSLRVLDCRERGLRRLNGDYLAAAETRSADVSTRAASGDLCQCRGTTPSAISPGLCAAQVRAAGDASLLDAVLSGTVASEEPTCGKAAVESVLPRTATPRARPGSTC